MVHDFMYISTLIILNNTYISVGVCDFVIRFNTFMVLLKTRGKNEMPCVLARKVLICLLGCPNLSAGSDKIQLNGDWFKERCLSVFISHNRACIRTV
jgi:hypothetical protein